MGNNLLSVWGTIGSVLLAVLILLVMITVHEFGHWLAGKILKFKINECSIGFGPAIFKHKNKKTDEVFAVRVIPLGGYCAFDGEDGLEEETPADGTPVFEEEFPRETAAEAQVSEKTEPAAAPAEPVGQAEKPRGGKFNEKKPWQRIIVLVAGALMNYLLALFLIVVCFFAYGQTMAGVYKAEASEEFAAEYSLKEGDLFLQAEGKNLYLSTDLASALNGKKKWDLVSLRISRIVVDEESGERNRQAMTVEIQLRRDVNVRNSADLDDVWQALGIAFEDGVAQVGSGSYRFGFFETLGRSFVYSFKIAGSIFKVIGELLTGNLGSSALRGPITTIKMTSQFASHSFRNFLEIAGFIGVNLAVFNLLPIPALDGSKVVFTVIEWIRKKPLSRKVEAVIHAVGFVLLLGFAVMVDILQFVL